MEYSYFSTNFETIDIIDSNINQTLNPDYNTLINLSPFNRMEYGIYRLRYKSQLGIDFNYETVEGPKIKDTIASIHNILYLSSFEINDKLTTQFGLRAISFFILNDFILHYILSMILIIKTKLDCLILKDLDLLLLRSYIWSLLISIIILLVILS